ncbi:hypothetical protein AAFH68_05180 [Flavobacterium sp. CGRL1]
MSNAESIINEIDTFLDKFSLKTNKLTKQDLISFIEEKWAEADDEKYNIYQAYIITGRMTNEYIWAKDFPNMKRWLDMNDHHSASGRNEPYIRNYYKGQCCLECGNEEKALEYFNLCYNENPDYIFTRAPFCYEFFNKHLENPRELPKQEEDQDDYFEWVELEEWQSFFNEEESEIQCEILFDDDEEEEFREEHENGIDYLENNQTEILESILTELLKVYPDWQKDYGYSEEDKPDFMPDVTTIKGFANLISPTAIYITSVFKDDLPYIGFLFSCSWDSEHGLGVMTHKNRIIEIGGADTAFLTWIAEKDNNKSK